MIRGASLLTMVDGARPIAGDLLVSGSRITALGRVDNAPADVEVLDRTGHYVMPGMIQTHVHLVQTVFRGLAEDLTLLDWLRRRVWPLEAAHDEETIRASMRLGLTELLLSGTTTVLDMGTTKGGNAQAEELIRSGIRAFFGQAMMDTGEGAPPDLLETTRASLDASAALTKQWNKSANGRLRYAYAPRFALSCTRDLLEAVATLAKMNDFLVHTHTNEDPSERTAIETVTGRAPVTYLAETGIASERTVAAHGVHIDDGELLQLRETKTAITHCPTSNLKLGAGVADVHRLRRAGLVVGLGADGAACNNRLDAFDEARMATLLARGLHGQGSLTAEGALLMGTREGARAAHRRRGWHARGGEACGPRRHRPVAPRRRRRSRDAHRVRRRWARRARRLRRRHAAREGLHAAHDRCRRGAREGCRGAGRATASRVAELSAPARG